MMQLIENIEISEPASIDVKKNMSTIEEAFDSNQINSSIANFENNVCAKISPSKTATVSKSVEDVNKENTIKAQIEDTVKNLNGVIKSNGDVKMEDKSLALDNIKIETEMKQLIERGASLNGESNGSSQENKSCKSPTSIPTDLSTMDVNKNLKKNLTIYSNEGPDKKRKLTNDMTITDFSSNDEAATAILSIENSPTVVSTQADVSNKQEVSDAEKLNDLEISIKNEGMGQNVSAFSPHSDTNEKEVNISKQLQQLEDDELMEDDFIKPLTDAKISKDNESNTNEQVPESNNDKPESPIQTQINDIQSKTTTEQKEIKDDIILEQEQSDTIDSLSKEANIHINGATAVPFEGPPTENKHLENIVLEKEQEINCTEGNSLHLSDEVISSIEKVPQEQLSVYVLNQEINEMDNTNVNKEISSAVIESKCVENDQKMCSSEVDMEVNTSKPIQEENQEKGSNLDPGVDKTSPMQKYITVKKFTDMAYPVDPTDETNINNEANQVSGDKQATEKDKSQENEVMEVDTAVEVALVPAENGIRLDTVNKLPLVEKKIEVKNNIQRADTETTKDEIQQMSIKQKDIDNVVMEIDDIDEVPALEKPGSDTEIIKDKKVVAEVKNCEETAKQDSVINIIDNDDEEKIDAPVDSEVKNDEISEVISIDDSVKNAISEESKKPTSDVEIMDDEPTRINQEKKTRDEKLPEKIPEKAVKQFPIVCKLSNTMDILSDEEDDSPIVKLSNDKVTEEPKKVEEQNKCINLDDDDDIMFIEDTNSQDSKDEKIKSEQQCDKAESQTINHKVDTDTGDKKIIATQNEGDVASKISEKDDSIHIQVDSQPKVEEIKHAVPTETNEAKPLITKSFLKSVTKNLADMTRNELEDFCILKLVESVVDKSNLNEIKNKMKNMAQTVEDLRKKALALTKQNRDLQVVVKTVQEDQKKRNANPMMPMKITRSVGMQVVLSAGEKSMLKKKLTTPTQPPPPMTPTRPVRNMQSPKAQKPITNNIPVPRLVPASSPTVKSPATPVSTATKPTPVRNTTPQRPEKRPHSKPSPASSVTVDLTDDEPPAKINTKNPAPPVRLVPSQNLMAPKTRPQFSSTSNSPRKVYIPISSNSQNIRPGQAVLKNFVPTPRPRQPSVVRMQTMRLNQAPSTNRHPAPLPDAMKQYQPPTWKALPPAPDLKLSKVDNGIVISWKFEGYQPDTYEEVASFQLYAYQETPAPPSTALWKKIGDIKALPLPMACTLTQFMSGFKYYFAVRAIDVRSRIGPFSLPGSIMLISKN